MDKEQDLAINYAEVVNKQIETAQETGDIPELFTYTHSGRKWVLTLPHSVMAQKRLLNARSQHMSDPEDFSNEEVFLRLIASLGEIEVLKLAYTDGLLAPLFLGGDREVRQYMEATIGHLGK